MDLREALSTAIGYEKKVRDHYQVCSTKVSDEKGQHIFRTLAAEEQGHVDYLESRLEEWKRRGAVTEAEVPSILPPPAWIEKEAKKRARKAVSTPGLESLEFELLKVALELERTTAGFYESLFTQLPPEHRSLFERFLEIERGHVLIVQAEIDSLAGHGHWFDFMEFSLEAQ